MLLQTNILTRICLSDVSKYLSHGANFHYKHLVTICRVSNSVWINKPCINTVTTSTKFLHRSKYERLHHHKQLSSLPMMSKLQLPFLSSSHKYFSSHKSYNPDDDPEKNLSLVQKFKLMYKQYWYVLLPVHVATSIVWFGSFFIMAKSGVDIVPTLEWIGVSESVLSHLRDSDAGYYALSYAMYKIATPARYTITVGGTTISINYLKEWGYIKPVPTKEKLKEMYEDKKEELIEKRDEAIERYQERRDGIKEKYIEKKEEMKEIYQEKREELIDKYQDRKENIKDKFTSKKDHEKKR